LKEKNYVPQRTLIVVDNVAAAMPSTKLHRTRRTRDGTRTSKDDYDLFCQDAVGVGRADAPAPALPLPSPPFGNIVNDVIEGGWQDAKEPR